MTSKQLRTARRRLGLNQTELGEKLDLSQRNIGRMENDELVINKRTEAAMKWLLHENGFNVV